MTTKIMEIQKRGYGENFGAVLLFVALLLSSFLFFASTASAATLSRPANNLGLVGHWSFDEGRGTQVGDRSGNKNHGTFFDTDTEAVWVSGKYGTAVSLDGLNDRIHIPSTAPLKYTGGNMTISVWVKPNINEVTTGDIISKPWNGNGRYNYRLSYQTNQRIQFHLQGATTYSLSSTQTVPRGGAYRHIVATVSENGVMKIYVDGIEDATANHTIESWTPSPADSNVPLSIGTLYPYVPSGWAGSNSHAFMGEIDDARIYDRVLSATEVRSLYSQGQARLTIPSSTGLVGYWTFDEGSGTQAGDASSSRNHGTLAGGVTWTDGIRGKALYFDGVNGWINNITQPNIQTGPNVFTITGFMKPGNQDSRFITPNSNGRDQFISFDSVNQTIRVSVVESANINGRTRASSNGSVPLNTWTHFSVSINDKNIKIYINGVLNSEYDESIDIGNWSGAWRIGQRGNGTSWYLGALDDLRVYNRELSPGEVQRIYESGNVTANTSSVTLTKNTSLADGLIGHWTFDGKDVTDKVYDHSGNGNDGYFVGSATSTAKTIGKLGQALSFNGSSNRVNLGNILNMGESDFSISAWVRSTSTAVGNNNGIIYKRGTAGSPNVGYALRMPNGTFNFHIADGTNFQNVTAGSSGAYNNGEWHHVVAVADRGSEMRVYINGLLVNSAVETTVGNIDSSIPLAIGSLTTTGSDTFHPFLGDIDDVRIYTRVLSANEVKQLYNLGR